MALSIKNKTVFITGASAGIGEACAEIFAQAGARLILTARRMDKIHFLAARLKEQFNTDSFCFQCDVRKYSEVEYNIKHLPAEWSSIDILINNAGLARGIEKIQDGVLQNWEEMIDTNVKGLLYISRVVLPKMIEKGSGHVVNIGSVAGVEVYPGGNVYCGSKHAVKAISKGMVIDLNGTGVRVTNIDPGLTETEFSIVRFRGDKEKADKVYEGFDPLTGKDIAEIALFSVTRPAHVSIQDILVTPSAQATATIVNRQQK